MIGELSDSDRIAANQIAREIIREWNAEGNDADFVDLAMALNIGIARAVATVRKRKAERAS